MTVEVTPGEMEVAAPPAVVITDTAIDDDIKLRRVGFYLTFFLFLVDVLLLVFSSTLYAGHTIDVEKLDPEVTLYHLATSFTPVILFLNFLFMLILLRWYRTNHISSDACGCGIFIYVLMTAACVAFFAVFMSMCNPVNEFENLPYSPSSATFIRTDNITWYNANNVYSQIGVGASTASIRFLGSYNTSDACIKACDDFTQMNMPSSSCHTWTWHYPVPQNYQYAGQCFGRTDLVWTAKAQTYVDCGVATNGGGVMTYVSESDEWTGIMFRDMLKANHDALALYVIVVIRMGLPVAFIVLTILAGVLFGLFSLIKWAAFEN
eukprot:TRINITY_DN3483_c0_g2_i1.p1 TRINITY_DN3483_c0_g2~~TRINITY_DN3483_c0_g2_i1.p1  ORF type:complete len:321 (-),score=78.56 TRINITY_DN3483_c0_g2_i1:126-1088(-)